MPNLPHLILPRVEVDLPRKKTGGGRPPVRDHKAHGEALDDELDSVLTRFRTRQRPTGIDPKLILRVQLHPRAGVDEDAWKKCGLSLLSVDKDKTLVLFSSDSELTEFRSRIRQYQQGPPQGQKAPPYQQLVSQIDHVGDIRPQDRIGRLLKSEGLSEPDAFEDEQEYVLDVELWEVGGREENRAQVAELRRLIARLNGRVTDDHVGVNLVLLRVRCRGSVVKEILNIEYVAIVDRPPRPTLSVGELINIGLEDFPEVPAPGEDAPGIAVLDSGLTSAHPLLSPAVGEATAVPRSIGDASDGHGHGTMVAGIALYGDVVECIETRSFVPRLTLYSARVLNDTLEFDDESLITSQMREAIQYLHDNYGCRVFNASLGDPRLPYNGGKVSSWASILDSLAREFNVVIVVSAGNYDHEPGDNGLEEDHIREYPRYLLDDAAKIVEPATGAIVLTVGSLAHAESLPPGSASDSVALRPVAQVNQPSPFTRCGPGLGDSIKPELCELGGNRAYDGLTRRVRSVRELGVISTHREFVQRLFTTDVGTSFAAPKVAHAAARLYEHFPEASANLIRAFLAASAQVPAEAVDLLQPLGTDVVRRLCGYGCPKLGNAQSSDESRVVLYTESELSHDMFHVYELPIPDELINESGTRRITITLAFDPPVRHTRIDYLGVKMSFRLIRGKSASEIAEAFRRRTKDESEVDRLSSTRYDCTMEPTPTVREGGTLQRATFTMKQKPDDEYGDTYHVVVRCEKKWAGEEYAPQRYAVVVVVEHSADVDLYSSIQSRVQQRTRIRAQQ